MRRVTKGKPLSKCMSLTNERWSRNILDSRSSMCLLRYLVHEDLQEAHGAVAYTMAASGDDKGDTGGVGKTASVPGWMVIVVAIVPPEG